MPKFLEKKLKSEARRKGMSGKRADAYVYGTMNNRGLMRGNRETAAGAAATRKHQRDVATSKRTGMSVSRAGQLRRQRRRGGRS